VAAAISLFGFQSGAALATVVGCLIEVPVMLLVVKGRQCQQGLVRGWPDWRARVTLNKIDPRGRSACFQS
jgi:hypothetical protein